MGQKVSTDFDSASSAKDVFADVMSPTKIFERAFDPELTWIERDLVRRFQSRHQGLLIINGFVNYTDSSRIIVLQASQFTTSIAQRVYIPEGIIIPPDNSYIMLQARPGHQLDSKPKARQPLYGIPHAEHWEEQPLPFDPPQPQLTRRDLKEYLFDAWSFPKDMQELLLGLYVSSPPFRGLIGGFSSGIQSRGTKIISQFNRYLRLTLPPEFTTRKPIIVKFYGTQWSPYKPWRLEIGMDSTIEELLLSRHDPLNSSEVSLATPIQIATAGLPDIPFVLDKHEFSGKYPRGVQLIIAKNAIICHYIKPTLTSTVEEKTQNLLEARMAKLVDKLEVDYSIMGKNQILDLNWDGKPLAALRLARSMARSLGRKSVSFEDVKQQVDQGLIPAITDYLETELARKEIQKRRGIDRLPERFIREVFLSILRLKDSCQNIELGPTIEEIAKELGKAGPKLDAALEKLVQGGVVFQPRPDHYKPLKPD